ncbi:MAG: type IV secretion system protein [Rickettsiales bacterium]|jgi:type IV secretory pathway component VirB8|nr:type IV secretion system protein [Rickettsiales bacterium]
MKKIDEQRYLWVCRAQALFLALSVAVLVILILAYDKINPGVKYEAFLVSGNPEVKSFKVARAPKSMTQGSISESIAKNLAAKYITMRESTWLDRSAANANIGEDSDLYYMSASDLYKQFRESAEYRDKVSNPARRSVVARVSAEDIIYMPKSGVFEAPVTLVSANHIGLDKTTSVKRVEITAEFRRGEELKSLAGTWRNPTGFTVLRYRILQ